MITLNTVKLNTNNFNKKYISFGENKQTKLGLISLDNNSSTKINFQKDLYESKNEDMVQTNPIKAFGYNIIKAYNILCTPQRTTEQKNSTKPYIHIPYMA